MDDAPPAEMRGRYDPRTQDFALGMGQQFELELYAPALALDVGPGLRLPHNVPALIAQVATGKQPLPRSRPQKAQPPLLPLHAIAFDAFRLTLVQCRWHVAANMAATVESRETEALHQLRVALRRLRVALVSFGGEFRTPQLEAIKLRAKSLAQLLAPARDLDVFMGELLEPVASANGSQEAFAVLRARAEAARRKAWDDAVLQVAGPRFHMFMSDLADIMDRGAWPLGEARGRSAAKSMPALEAPARELAERMLAHRHKQACKHARHLGNLSVAERHELRIALKKLRYTAEFFAPFFEQSQVKKFVRRLARMQDVLGALNDVAVAKNILESLVGSDEAVARPGRSDVSFVGGIVYGWHLERAEHTWNDAVRRWKKFAHTKEFWL